MAEYPNHWMSAHYHHTFFHFLLKVRPPHPSIWGFKQKAMGWGVQLERHELFRVLQIQQGGGIESSSFSSFSLPIASGSFSWLHCVLWVTLWGPPCTPPCHPDTVPDLSVATRWLKIDVMRLTAEARSQHCNKKCFQLGDQPCTFSFSLWLLWFPPFVSWNKLLLTLHLASSSAAASISFFSTTESKSHV